MEKKNKNLILNIIALIGLTLTGVFIQISNEKINSHNTELIFDMVEIVHMENLIAKEHLDLISFDVRELVGGFPQEENMSLWQDQSLGNITEITGPLHAKSFSVQDRLEYRPVCLTLKCSSLNTILYIIQVLIISFLIILNIKINKSHSKEN